MKLYFKNIFSAILAGFSMLGLVHVLGVFFGFTIKINIATLGIACFLGAPGVIVLLLLAKLLVV